METALRYNTIILPGQRIELSTPELPVGSCVELIIRWQQEADSSKPDLETENRIKNGDELQADYASLIGIQWRRKLTESEQKRLDSIKAEINARYNDSDSKRMWEHQIRNIHQQLSVIRHEIESLPDAS